MRILAITNMYPTASKPALGTFVQQQVKGLRSAGLDVDVLFVDRRQEGVTAYMHLPARIRSRLRAFDADVVHVMYGGVMADVASRAVRDRPVVVTFHGSDLLGEHLSGRVRRIIAHYGVLSSRRAARRADAVVVVSKRLKEALPADVDSSKVRIIPCGIDTGRFVPMDRSACRQQLSWDGDTFRVLFNTNGDDPVKRPGLARAAVQNLARAGVPAVLQELRGVSNADVPVRLNASDVLLLTSLHEGSPTVVKEALACDVPVVSVDVGDVREQIDGIEGCYLASADENDLANKLMCVYSGRRRVQARDRMEGISLGRIAVRLKALYQELIAFDARRLGVESRENTVGSNPVDLSRRHQWVNEAEHE